MKRHFVTAAVLGMVGGLSAIIPLPANADNSGVESALAGYSDVSVFYQALVNTGVIHELNENTHYTVFAPTNAAFAEIRASQYPCFYTEQCRAQVADVLRDHIVVGKKSLKELTNWVEVPTIGHYRVYAASPFIGDYTIANHKVLSGGEMHGSMVYRIDGVIINDAQLAQFRNPPPMAGGVVEEKTITTYRTPAAYEIPGGYDPSAMETVSEKTYAAPAYDGNGAAVYTDGDRIVTTRRTYRAPNVAPAGGSETTTVTRTITTEE